MKMDLENYKKQVEQNLIERVGQKEAARLMRDYEKDFPKLFDMNLSVTASATALIMGY